MPSLVGLFHRGYGRWDCCLSLRLRALRQRQTHREGRANPDLAPEADLAAVSFDRVATDTEPEASAATI